MLSGATELGAGVKRASRADDAERIGECVKGEGATVCVCVCVCDGEWRGNEGRMRCAERERGMQGRKNNSEG